MRTVPIVRERFLLLARLLVAIMVLTAIAPPRWASAAGATADVVLGQLGFAYNGWNLTDERGVLGPQGVAVDRSVVPNRIYVADSDNSRVLAWPDVSAFASGDPAQVVIGQPDVLSSGCNTGGVSATSLCLPVGVAVDAAGNLYVADLGNSRVLEYDTPFTSGTSADRVFGQAGSFTTNTVNLGGVSATSLHWPSGVAVDAPGNLYVADWQNHRVLEYDTPLASDVIADRVFGQGGSATTATCNLGGVSATSLCAPVGVAVDATGNLYVADEENDRVLEYDMPLASDVIADRVFGQGGSFTTGTCNLGGVSAASLCGPQGVAVDATGNVYVVDASNNRVVEYDAPLMSDATADRVFGQAGNFASRTCSLGGVSATSLCLEQVGYAAGVATDGAGNLYVADSFNNRVLAYDTPLVTDDAADRVLGQVGLVYYRGNLTDARGVAEPHGVAIDRSAVPNRVYVVDHFNNRVLAWADVTTLASGDPADLVIGQPDFRATECGVGATSLCFPRGVAVDGAGNLYVADSGNSRVLEYDTPFTSDGAADRVFGQGGSFTSGACNLGGVSATSLCLGFGDGPDGIAVDAAGNLYVADRQNHRILEYDTPLVSDVVADRVFGQGGSFTTGTCNLGGVSATSLCGPSGVAVDAAGNLYVTDSNANRVLEYDTPMLNDSTADRVFGQGGRFDTFACNLGGVSAASLCHPTGVAVDAAGNLYVADDHNHRVLAYDTPLTQGVVADEVFGQGGSFAGDACNLNGPGATSLCGPVGVAVDGAGDLYVADAGNHRVLGYDAPLAGPCTTALDCPLCWTCSPMGLCVEGARTACKVPNLPGQAQLLLADATPDLKDRVQFRWARGQATTFAELGDPLATHDYALCVYDGTNGLLVRMIAPAGTCGATKCWKAVGGSMPRGFRYNDVDNLPHDLDQIRAKAGVAGKASMSVKGRGDDIPLPPLGALTLPLTAQLQNELGSCWEATFSTPSVSTTARFKARSD